MNLDLTKILKGCEGMTFYHTLIGDYVTLCDIIPDSEHPIRYNYEGAGKGSVSRCGKHWNNYPDGECVFFPSKEQRDWSKFKKPLAVDTPVMASAGTNWVLRFYAGNNSCFIDGHKSDKQVKDNWRYIVPVSEFDFENPESNKEKSI